MLAETKICEWISLIIRYIGEIMFQVSYYGLLVAQRIFLHILAAFAPLMFAISLSPHYKSAWSQWLSKYISVSLWGFVTYLCLYYIDFIMQFNLEQDITSYKSLIGSVSADTDGDAQIGAIGMQAVGSTCMYVVGLLVGVRVIAFVPEVASWLIPGWRCVRRRSFKFFLWNGGCRSCRWCSCNNSCICRYRRQCGSRDNR